MKNFAIVIGGFYFYAEPMSNNGFKFIPVPEPKKKEVHEMIRYQQIDMYISDCKEKSCEIVEHRIYDISSGLTLATV